MIPRSATAAAVAVGGWAQALGVSPSTPLDQALITRILDIAEPAIRNDPSMRAIGSAPGGFLLVEQLIRDWRSSTENALRKLIGVGVGSIPNDLSQLARQGNVIGDGTLFGDVAGDIVAGLGEVAGRAILLGVILVAIVLGAWRIVSPAGRTVIVQQLRRTAA